MVWYRGKWPQVSGWADKKWPRSRGKCPRLGQKMPSDNSTGGQALNLCSTRAVCGSAQCRFLYFVVFMFVFFAFCIFKRKSLLGQMWRCLWITSVSLQLTTSLSHHPSVTKPAQDVMLYTFSVGSYINSYILKAWNYWGRWNAIDDVNGLSMEEEDGGSQGRQIMADNSISGRHLHFPFNWGSQKIFSTAKGEERWKGGSSLLKQVVRHGRR